MARTPLTGWKATAAVSMSNYIDSGSIIAIATSLGFWGKAYFPDDDGTIAGLLAAFSANAFGAAIGALIGGPLCDKYGRKFIYTYDLLLYALGGLVVVFTSNLAMLFAGFIIIGLAVGASVPAGWTYIAEFAPTEQRGRHIGATQLAWSFGPFIGFGLAAALTPLGLLGSRIIFAHLVAIALATWYIRRSLEESETWETAKGGADAKPPSMWASFRKLFNRRVNITALVFLAVIYTCWRPTCSPCFPGASSLSRRSSSWVWSTGCPTAGTTWWVGCSPSCPGSSLCSARPTLPGPLSATRSSGASPRVRQRRLSTPCGLLSCSRPRTARRPRASSSSWCVSPPASSP